MTLTASKTLKLTSLVLFIFIGVITFYLVFNEQYDGQMLRDNQPEIIVTDDNILQQSEANYNIIPTNPITQTLESPQTDTDILHSITEQTETSSNDEIKSIHNNEQSTNNIIPSSWQQLNDQQFCTIHKNTPQQILMQRIYAHQFERDCNDINTKYLIYDISLERTRGLGASLYGYLCRYMVVALQINRTLLFHGKFDWAEDKTYCNGKNAMECYFLPLSNCDSIHILSSINKSDSKQFHQGRNPIHCVFGDNDQYNNKSHCEERVILINKKIRKPLLQRPISHFAEKHFNMKIFEFESVLVAFFLRPQAIVKQIIYEKISKSLNKSLNGTATNINNLDASQYISLPIRASDKCKNIVQITHKHYTHKPEISCFTPIEYVLLMNVMKYYSNTLLRGVILTSEDSSFINEVIHLMKYSNRSNVSDWNIILNTEDYSVGEGTTTYKYTKKIFNESSSYSTIGTSLYTDHIISALSSLILQVHLETEYLLWLYESSWTELMWNWLAILNCNIKKEKHIPNYNKCVKLLFSGYIHHRNHNKVEFAKDIFEKIKNDSLNVQQFYNKFGLWYSNKSFCHIEGSKKRIAKR